MQHLTITISTSAEANTQENTLPELTMIDGIAYCTSLQVADHFGKQHKHVMRDIEDTITQVIESSEKPKSGLTETLFKKAEYALRNNFGHNVNKPMYLLTEEGFTLLAMGYTGVKAMGFKLKYMAAFKQMREMLTRVAKQPPRPTKITAAQLADLNSKLDNAVLNTLRKDHNRLALVNYLKVLFSTESLAEIPYERTSEAFEFVDKSRGYINDLRHTLANFESEAIGGYITRNAPHIPSLKRKWRNKLDWMQPGNPVDIAKLITHDYLARHGMAS